MGVFQRHHQQYIRTGKSEHAKIEKAQSVVALLLTKT